MLRSVSHHCQVIVSAQSGALVDSFTPEDVIVVDRWDGASTVERLSESQLHEWLQEYSLGELCGESFRPSARAGDVVSSLMHGAEGPLRGIDPV
jgi:hypothetical protein